MGAARGADPRIHKFDAALVERGAHDFLRRIRKSRWREELSEADPARSSSDNFRRGESASFEACRHLRNRMVWLQSAARGSGYSRQEAASASRREQPRLQTNRADSLALHKADR